jgi:hypothetical protein
VAEVRSEFERKVKENLPSGLEPSEIRLQPQGTAPTGNHRLLLEATAKAYLDVWADLLDEAEVEAIRSISNPDQVLILSMKAKRVELAIEERFVGNPPNRVTVATGMDGGDCGIPFEVGRRYLVIASRGRGGVYYTGACWQTAPVEAEPHALAALRAWKHGEEFPRTVYGWLSGWTRLKGEDSIGPLDGQSIRLVGAGQSFETVTDSKGNFEWSNLPAGKYVIQVERSGWTMAPGREIDLQSNRCVYSFVTMDENQRSR